MSALYRKQSIKKAQKKMSDEFIEEAIKKSPILLRNIGNIKVIVNYKYIYYMSTKTKFNII